METDRSSRGARSHKREQEQEQKPAFSCILTHGLESSAAPHAQAAKHAARAVEIELGLAFGLKQHQLPGVTTTATAVARAKTTGEPGSAAAMQEQEGEAAGAGGRVRVGGGWRYPSSSSQAGSISASSSSRRSPLREGRGSPLGSRTASPTVVVVAHESSSTGAFPYNP